MVSLEVTSTIRRRMPWSSLVTVICSFTVFGLPIHRGFANTSGSTKATVVKVTGADWEGASLAVEQLPK